MRAIFFEAEDARRVVEALVRDGFQAELSPERYAGEDDDEAHAWAVTSDAPDFMLEVHIDEYDGWLDKDSDEAVGGSASVPLQLPTQPIRIKRPESVADHRPEAFGP